MTSRVTAKHSLLDHPAHEVGPDKLSSNGRKQCQWVILYKTGMTKSFILMLLLEIGPEKVIFLYFIVL